MATKDLNPYSPFIKGSIIPILMQLLQGGGKMPAYPGQLHAPVSPSTRMAQQLAMMRAQSGGPRGYQQAQNFSDTYASGRPVGYEILNGGGPPPGPPGGGGGGGMPGPGAGMPPGGMGGNNRMDMGGSPQQQPMGGQGAPSIQMILSLLSQLGQGGGGGGGMNDRMPFVAFGRPTNDVTPQGM